MCSIYTAEDVILGNPVSYHGNSANILLTATCTTPGSQRPKEYMQSQGQGETTFSGPSFSPKMLMGGPHLVLLYYSSHSSENREWDTYD